MQYDKDHCRVDIDHNDQGHVHFAYYVTTLSFTEVYSVSYDWVLVNDLEIKRTEAFVN